MRFMEAEPEPVAVIDPEVVVPFSITDLTLLDVTEQRAALDQIGKSTSLWSFDLSQSPLMRVSVARLGAEHHVVFIVMHHLVADGMSLAICVDELFDAYGRLLRGDALKPIPSIQYGDYAAWQRRLDESSGEQESVSRVKNRLAGAPQVHLLACEGRPESNRSEGAVGRIFLDNTLGLKMRTLVDQERVTPFMVMLAAYFALLARFSDQEDLTVGIPVSLRDAPETATIIGNFLNTVVVRHSVERDASFTTLLRKVRAATLEALDSRGASFGAVVSALGGVRQPNRNPVFQVMFVYQTLPSHRREYGELVVQPEQMHNGTAKLDLTLEVADTAEGTRVALEYDTDLFDSGTAHSLLSAYRCLLTSAVSDPGIAIDALPTVSQDEGHTRLTRWNNNTSVFPTDVCIADLIEAQVVANPGRTAVVFDSQDTSSLSYAELDSAAESLAAQLMDEGASSNHVVAILSNDPGLGGCAFCGNQDGGSVSPY